MSIEIPSVNEKKPIDLIKEDMKCIQDDINYIKNDIKSILLKLDKLNYDKQSYFSNIDEKYEKVEDKQSNPCDKATQIEKPINRRYAVLNGWWW